MTRYAPVCPLPLLKDLFAKSAGYHGSYHLLLAHDVLANQGAYAEHFENMRDYFGRRFVVLMDNSIVELGNAVNMEQVEIAGAVVGADVLILPDVMGNGKETLAMFKSIVPTLNGNFGYMAVPQGPTIGEFAACLEEYARWHSVSWVGIPRIATQQLGSRQKLIALAKLIKPDWHVHLLGFSDNVVDDMLCANLDGIMGIDSAVPVRAGQKGLRFNLANSDYGKRGDYWEATEYTQTALDNIRYVRMLVGEGN